MELKVRYDKSIMNFNLEEKNYLMTLTGKAIETKNNPEAEIRYALENPIGSRKLTEIVNAGERIAIVTSDITRPVPSYIILPIVVEELRKANVREEDITIVLALGCHRGHTEEEKKKIVGDRIYHSSMTIMDSNINECVNLGVCNNGTPVDIFKPIIDADRIICIGNIEYHYFAGYSGGIKALMPGTSSYLAIQSNHSNMVNPLAKAGNLDTNPVRQDIDQTGEFIKVDFILNVVLNESKEIMKAFAGHYIEAHREGCKFLDSIYGVKLEVLGDIVVASPGGFPKDINLYQAQKGLDNAKNAVRKGGVIILTASAKEGFGEKTFESWMLNKNPQQMVTEIKEDFILGGHKAAAIAIALQKAKIYFVSDMDDNLVRRMNFVPYDTIQHAINDAIRALGGESKVIIMPQASSTLPLYNLGH